MFSRSKITLNLECELLNDTPTQPSQGMELGTRFTCRVWRATISTEQNKTKQKQNITHQNLNRFYLLLSFTFLSYREKKKKKTCTYCIYKCGAEEEEEGEEGFR